MPILALLSHLFLPQQEQSLWRTCLAWLRGRVELLAIYLLSSEVRPNAARRAMPYMQTYVHVHTAAARAFPWRGGARSYARAKKLF